MKTCCVFLTCINVCEFNSVQQMATQYKNLKTPSEKSELLKAWCCNSSKTHQNDFTSCLEGSNCIISSLSTFSVLCRSVATAKCNQHADITGVKFIFSCGTRIRTIKERNHSLIGQLTEMKGVLSSKRGNWFLQGTGGRDLVSLHGKMAASMTEQRRWVKSL